MACTGVQGHRGDLSPSPLDAQRNAVRFSQIMSQNGPTDHSHTKQTTRKRITNKHNRYSVRPTGVHIQVYM
eukprot:5635097-Heterocapsa_arctica.AAC.1